MKIGIFFGGQSREREVSFSGARTVWEALDKSLFEGVLIFVDSLGNFIQIKEDLLYKKNIRAFYPPRESSDENKDFSIYAESLGELTHRDWVKTAEKAGTFIYPNQFKEVFDFAFILLHGPYGEDGSIQGLLEWYNVPYSGCGVMSSAIGIDKHFQKRLQHNTRPYDSISKTSWLEDDKKQLFESLKSKVGLPLVIKAPYQGSSIGVSILKEDNLAAFSAAVESCMFLQKIKKEDWQAKDENQKKEYIKNLIELDKGIGLPVVLADESFLAGDLGDMIFYNPTELIQKLDAFFEYADDDVTLSSLDSEEVILFESFIEGKEFSCGVIQDSRGKAIALPPTEITTTEHYDFEAKYSVGGSRKVIPIDVQDSDIERIREVCREHFEEYKYSVCARIDGFITDKGEIFLIDTNTVPGMSPTSLIFRQAAEIGLSPTQLITYQIEMSLRERIKTGKKPYHLRFLLENIDQKLQNKIAKQTQKSKQRIVIPSEGKNKNEALAKARAIYTELNSKGEIIPMPVLQVGEEFYSLPVSFLLKPSVEEILASLNKTQHLVIKRNIMQAKSITEQFVGYFEPLAKKVN
jgi:D-alanine-D-alanine ligase